MKKLEFTTSKGEFIIVDSIGRENYYEVLRSEGLQVYHIGMLRDMTEEQFAEVFDEPINHSRQGNYYSSYRQKFESLIKSLGWYLFENPYSNFADETGYQEAESKTLYSPILLKKI